MIFYEDEVLRRLKKDQLPRPIFELFNNAFIALNVTKDMNLFDVKRLKSNAKRAYYRVRKGKYRAIFYVERGNFYVISIAKRGEVYRQWE